MGKTKLLRKKKKTEKNTFWKTVKHLFTDKVQRKPKITLIEKKVVSGEGQEQIVSEKVISAEIFNKFFINIVPNLRIPTNHSYDANFLVTNDQVVNALNKLRNHPSIAMIKKKRKTDQQCYSFGPVTYEDMLKKTNNLDTAKVSQQFDIPTKPLKQNSRLFYRNLLWKYQPGYFEISVSIRFKIGRYDSNI